MLLIASAAAIAIAIAGSILLFLTGPRSTAPDRHAPAPTAPAARPGDDGDLPAT
jgi:hypothetical protein